MLRHRRVPLGVTLSVVVPLCGTLRAADPVSLPALDTWEWVQQLAQIDTYQFVIQAADVDCAELCRDADNYEQCIIECELDTSFAEALDIWQIVGDTRSAAQATQIEASLLAMVSAWVDHSIPHLQATLNDHEIHQALGKLANSYHTYLDERRASEDEDGRAFWSETFAVVVSRCLVAAVEVSGDAGLREQILNDMLTQAEGGVLKRTSSFARVGLYVSSAHLVRTNAEVTRLGTALAGHAGLQQEIVFYRIALGDLEVQMGTEAP